MLQDFNSVRTMFEALSSDRAHKGCREKKFVETKLAVSVNRNSWWMNEVAANSSHKHKVSETPASCPTNAPRGLASSPARAVNTKQSS
jgi:hypothetical protein